MLWISMGSWKMNRIYRSIWCEKTGTFVAVSENTKRGRKAGASADKTELGSCFFHAVASKALLPALFTGAIALFSPMAWASGDLTTAECTFSWGNDSGGTITIKGEGTGTSNTQACAEALQGLVDNPLEYFSVNSTGGGNINNDGAAAPDGIAIGKDASVSVGATSGVALGLGATTTVANGIALGAGSVANTAAGIAPYAPVGASVPSIAAVNATTSSLGALSVGDPATGKLRQITGVAGGTQDT